MTNITSVVAYRLHVWIRQISPMIWRRLLVRSDSTIADLHDTLQIAFGWSDAHLNLFHIHGQLWRLPRRRHELLDLSRRGSTVRFRIPHQRALPLRV